MILAVVTEVDVVDGVSACVVIVVAPSVGVDIVSP